VEFLSHCSKGFTAVTAGSVVCISLRVSLVIIQLKITVIVETFSALKFVL